MEQKRKSYVDEPLVIENPSPKLVAFLNKLRDRQQAIFEEIQKNHDVYFPSEECLFHKQDMK